MVGWTGKRASSTVSCFNIFITLFQIKKYIFLHKYDIYILIDRLFMLVKSLFIND